MAPIYLCAGATFSLFFYKLLQFHGARLSHLDWMNSITADLRAGDTGAAQHTLSKIAHPAARAVEAAVLVATSRPARVSAEASRQASLEMQQFERYIGGLSLAAQIAPLLGLLGTVAGLVQLFMDVEASGRGFAPGQLSAGMWTALLTTATGLAVAVVALAGYHYLAARADRLRLTLHDVCERALTALPPEPGKYS